MLLESTAFPKSGLKKKKKKERCEKDDETVLFFFRLFLLLFVVSFFWLRVLFKSRACCVLNDNDNVRLVGN